MEVTPLRHRKRRSPAFRTIPWSSHVLPVPAARPRTLFFLARPRRFAPPPLAGSRSPESEAKNILAERFARGDITTDGFMERASFPSWTPGTDPYDIWKPSKKRR